MRRDVVVMTCIAGGYDTPKQAPQGFEAHLFTTTDPLDDWVATIGESRGWIVHRFPDARHPRMVAGTIRWEPWRWLPDHDVNIWIDGSYEPLEGFDGLADYGFAALKSPWRVCHEAELKFMNGLSRYGVSSPIRAMHAIRDRGMPRRWGLWMTGMLVRDRRIPGVAEAHRDVLRLVDEYTCADQGLLPYACWNNGIRPETLPGSPDNNDFALLHPHSRVRWSG